MLSANRRKFPDYRLPVRLAVPVAWCALTNTQRSFRRDAIICLRGMVPPLYLEGQENIPAAGPFLVVTNHYHRPGFGAWWISLAISTVLPLEAHWMMTGAWTYRDALRSRTLEPLTHWAFTRLARCYNFTLMPPMPPRAHEANARSLAVRRVVAYARQAANPVIALAPEGQDYAGGVLGWPPAGVGRFIAHLARYAPLILPVGAFESGGRFCLHFGPAVTPDFTEMDGKNTLDRDVSEWVMCLIARQLPVALRGEFG